MAPAEAAAEQRPVSHSTGVPVKAMDVVDALVGHATLSPTDVSRRAGVHKLTTIRILSNVEAHGDIDCATWEPATTAPVVG